MEIELIEACKNGYINKVKSILKNNKINPNLQGEYGKTALLLASQKCYTGIVKLLLNHKNYCEKIDINLQDEYGRTVLSIPEVSTPPLESR